MRFARSQRSPRRSDRGWGLGLRGSRSRSDVALEDAFPIEVPAAPPLRRDRLVLGRGEGWANPQDRYAGRSSGNRDYAFPTELALTATDDDSESVRAAYLTSKRLRKGITSAREWEHIRSLARSNPGHFQGSLERIFGTEVTPRLVEAVEEGVPPDPAVSRRARMHAWLRRVRNPERAASLAAKSVGRLFERVMHPTGLTVVVAGPDGSGKSTLADLLLRSYEGPFRRHVHIHWRPGVLPSLGTIVGRAPGDPTDPHGRPAHGGLGSSAALVYYWMDFLLGSWLRVWPIRARSGLVVVERGWWDIAVDPRRYRMQVSPRMVAALGRLLPSPDLVLTLEASVETLAERKGELPAPEAQRQMDAWRRIVPRHIPQAFLDVSGSIDDVAASARDVVFERLSARALRRLGAGWIGLPHTRSPRWILPRGPRRAAVAGPSIYEPVTLQGRIGWELARIAASMGAFRFMPRSRPPPRVVREALATHIPTHATLATTRANHPGRYVVAVITEAGETAAIAKVASDTEGRERLRAEDEAIARFGSCLGPTVRAPTVIAREDGLLLLEAAAWRPRRRPWVLPTEVAQACGELFRIVPSPVKAPGVGPTATSLPGTSFEPKRDGWSWIGKTRVTMRHRSSTSSITSCRPMRSSGILPARNSSGASAPEMVGLDPLSTRTEQQRASLCSRLLNYSPSTSDRPLPRWMHARGTAGVGSSPGDRSSRPWERQTSYRHRERRGFDVPARINPSTCSRQDRATLSQERFSAATTLPVRPRLRLGGELSGEESNGGVACLSSLD